jgi:hypothetical protein
VKIQRAFLRIEILLMLLEQVKLAIEKPEESPSSDGEHCINFAIWDLGATYYREFSSPPLF